jgi:hypothetical protein
MQVFFFGALAPRVVQFSCFAFAIFWQSWHFWQYLSVSDNKRRFMHSAKHSATRLNAPVVAPETSSFPPRRGRIVLTN